jgi:para-aminobenzoate synthetase component 1
LNPASKESRENFSWPDFYFFEPEYYFLESRDGSVESNFSPIAPKESFPSEKRNGMLAWSATETQKTYLDKIEEIKECIRQGVFYEMNFCQQFHTTAQVDPYELFKLLNQTSPSPFACFYKLGKRYLIGASPERFLKKTGRVLMSQPIKGTARRKGGNDNQERVDLESSEKDRAENIMIVDLVRNDLSKVSKVGSVQVQELCGVYSYPTVHQLISTVQSELENEVGFSGILEALFPMGSMTGAPKLEVMKHIDRMEGFKRGIYSGSIGYWNRGDFDLNVVIRSLEYEEPRLTYAVGGAITFDSVGEEEWEECQIKAGSLRRLF